MKAVIFPGQGSEYPGMGKDLYDSFPQARKMFSRLDNLFGLKISQICFEGTKQDLGGMYVQQLAVFIVSLVAYELFKQKNKRFDFVSGLSLGGYTCLYPAEVLEMEDLVRLVKARAQATEQASKLCRALLLAVIGLNKDTLEKKSKELGFYVANINSPQQIVISLKEENKEELKTVLEKMGAKVVEIGIKGGFHCPLMQAAEKPLKKVADSLIFRQAKIPIISNVTACAHTDAEQIKNNLIKQLTFPVLWQDSVDFMIKSGVDLFFEIGPSRILRGLIRKINPKVKVINIEKKDDLDNVLTNF